MNRLLLIAFSAVFFVFGGCAVTSPQAASTPSGKQIAFAALSDSHDASIVHVEPGRADRVMRFRLGAGDALGHSMFVNYVAYVRANRIGDAHYATGAIKE